jgi:hypothetical protein
MGLGGVGGQSGPTPAVPTQARNKGPSSQISVFEQATKGRFDKDSGRIRSYRENDRLHSLVCHQQVQSAGSVNPPPLSLSLCSMGNSNGRQSGVSSPRHQPPYATHHQVRTFDGGSLSPHGVYPGQADYNPTHVIKLIRERRLAPFYKGLDDYEDDWTDYQLSYMVRHGKLPPTADPPSPAPSRPPSNSSTPSLLLPPCVDDHGNLRPNSSRTRGMSFVENGQQTPNSPTLPNNDIRGRPRAQTTGSSSVVPTRTSQKPLEAVVYRDAIECPVCFLVNPPYLSINTSSTPQT